MLQPPWLDVSRATAAGGSFEQVKETLPKDPSGKSKVIVAIAARRMRGYAAPKGPGKLLSEHSGKLNILDSVSVTIEPILNSVSF